MRKFLLLLLGLVFGLAIQAQTVIYHENFEAPSLGDSVTPSGTPSPWAINTRLFAEGARCDSNFVQASDTSYLVTSVINCTGYANVVLKFSHICKIEVTDAAEIEVSINNGAWIKLTTQYVNPGNSQFITNGYKFTSTTYTSPDVWSWAVGTAKPLNSWWMPEQFDISALAGNQANVRIRFSLRDGTTNGANWNHGWYIDNVRVLGAVSELTPPVITYRLPVVQDTIFNTGPFDIFAGIKDVSGIDSAWLTYTVNGGANNYLPMTWISDTTYKATIPSYTWNTAISYFVSAIDSSLSHNQATAGTKNFYIKKGPSDVVIGTGTSTGSYPFRMGYGYTRSASIYTQSEVNQYGSILTLAWNIYATASANDPVRIYLKNTASSVQTAETWASLISGATLVYDGTTAFNTAGWKSFILTAPFTYSSGNLMVLCESNYGSYGTSGPSFYYTSAANKHEYFYQDNSAPTGNGYVDANRPNITLGFAPTNFMFDAAVSQIVSPTGTVIPGTNVPVTVKIANPSVDTINTVTIKYSVDGVYRDSINWSGILYAGVTTANFDIDTTNFGLGFHTIKAWTVRPNGGVDQNMLNDTATGSFYVCTSALAGPYTIGGGGDFTTFAAAIGSLHNCGISGPVTFNVLSGTYNELLTLNAVLGSSAVNTITFKPAAGATVILTNNTTTATLKLNGADNIIFDGSNNGTTSRDMSIVNSSTAGSTAAIWLASSGTGAGCDHVTIKNCNLSMGVNSTTNYAVFAGGSTIGSTGADNDYLTVENNLISKAYYGVSVLGIATTGICNDINISENNFKNSVVASYIGYRAVNISQATNVTVNHNTIGNIIGTISSPCAINISTGVTNASVTRNDISGIRYTGTGGYGAFGILVNTGVAPSNVLIANNMISDILADGDPSGFNYTISGIMVDGTTGGIDIYNNSIYLSGDASNGGSTYVGKFGCISINTAVTALNIRNNILFNTISKTNTAASRAYAFYSLAANTAFTDINYNDYWVAGTQTVLGYLGANVTTLAAWRTATGKDVASISADPVFTSTSNLHTFAIAVNAVATPIAVVTTDIDGEARNATTPDMGADEFTPLANDIAILSILAPVNGCGYSSEQVRIRIKNLGGDPITVAELYYTINGGAPVHETFNGTIASNATTDYTFTTLANVAAPGTYIIDAWVDLVGDPNNLNDTINNYSFYSGYDFSGGAFTMGFEPTESFSDWTVTDVNADTRTWQIPYLGASYAHSGNNSARFYNSSTLSGNDWLFTRCFNLNAGSTYKIEYWYRAESASGPQNISLKYGSTATPAGMTTTLNTLSGFANVAYQKASVTFSPPSSGVYYFGWQATSNASLYFAFIDDINIVVVPDQEAAALNISTPSNGCGLTATEVVTLQIKNTGAQVINGNLTAYYQIAGTAPVSEAVMTAINAGDTLDFAFATTADLHVVGQDSVFAVKAWIALTGDPFAFNDTTAKSVNSKFIPADPTAVGDTIPYGGIATLTASSPDYITWWGVPSGGTSIGNGNTYVTPTLYTTTVYYVQAQNGAGNQNWTFDSGLEGWTATMPCASPVTWAWSSDAGNGTAFAVNHTTNSSQLLTSPVVNVQGAANTTLSFRHRYATEAGWDHGFVAYRLDGGAWAQFIPTTGSYNTNDGEYNEPLFSSCATSGNMPLFDGTSAYITSSGNINVAGASNLQLAFVFTTDGSGDVDGWYIDNVNLSGMSSCASNRIPDTAHVMLMDFEAGIVGIPAPVGGCTNGSEPVTLRIRNNGGDTITTFDASYQANTAPVVTETVNTLLLPGDSLSYTFATLLNTGVTVAFPDTTIDLSAWIVLASDGFNSNDSITTSVDFSLIADMPVVSNVTIPYGTSTTITAVSADSITWYDALTGGNLLGEMHSFTTPLLYGTTIYYAEAANASPGIMIDGLGATNSAVVDHESLSGDDRGGVAVTENYFYVNGDNNAVRFDMPDLTNPVAYTLRDGFFSNLAGTGTLYTLWNGTVEPTGYSLSAAYTVTSINELNADLSLGTNLIPLTQTITLGSGSTCAIFSGKDFAIIYNGINGTPANTFYRIDLPSGTVTTLGSYTLTANSTECWARWGTAEIIDGDYCVAYVAAGDAISRLNLTTGAVTTVSTFTDLSDMAGFTVAPWYNRWYFHYEGSGQFGGTSETAGYADALLSVVQGCPSDRVADTVFVTGAPTCDMSVTAITSPVSGIELSNAETVTVTVYNYGIDPAINIPVNYSVNGGTAVTEIIAGPLAPGAQMVYSFTATADLSTLGSYSLIAFTTQACDTITVNDSLEVTIENDPLMYCTSGATSIYDNDLGNVTFANINNGTASPILSNVTSVNLYTDFTSLPPAQIIAGATVPISITQIEAASWFYDCQVNVYIDWNRNGTFDLPTELVFGQATGSDENFPTVSGMVNVPTTGVVTGQTLLMRVVLDESNVAPPCGTYTWGETEDYYVVVSPQLQFDAGVTAILQPNTTQDEGELVPVEVVVKNYGTDTIKNTTGLSVGYSLNGQAPVLVAWTGGNLASGASTSFILPDVTIPAGNSEICAWTVLAPDTNIMNDSICKSFYGNPNTDAGVIQFLQPVSMNGFENDIKTVEVLFANHGSDTLFTIPVSYSLNGVLQGTFIWSDTLLPGSMDTVLFTQTFQLPAGGYDLCAFTGLVTDGDHTNDTLCASGNGLFTATLPYYDNFDGAVNWSSEVDAVGNLWQLGAPAYGVTNSAHSAPNAWDVNLTSAYTANAEAYLYTQNFDFSSAVSAKIAFWVNVDVEDGYDGLTLEYSTDSSATWQILGAVGDPNGTNWYNANNDVDCWETTGGWMRSEYIMTVLNNEPSVRFRFFFHSDGSGQESGASVDDISIVVPGPIDAGVEQIKQPTGFAPAGSSKVVKVRIRNFGTDTLTSIPVHYAVNGGVPVTGTWTGQLASNDTITYTFATPLTVPGGLFNLCAYTGVTGDYDHLNDTSCIDMTGIVTFVAPWSDDMEGNVYMFADGGNASWEFGVPASTTINAAHSPTHCWKTNLDGFYMNNSADYLYTPYISFTQVADATLDFWHWYQTETNTDGGKIEYSINGGSWITLGYVGDPAATNWYNATLTGAPHWSGNSAGWVHSTYNLSTIPTIVNATTPVQFRYKFYSSASTNNFDGWAIDDFAITAPLIAKDAGVSAILNPSAPTMTGSAVTVQVTIENFGTDTLQTVPVAYIVNGGLPVVETWTGVLQPATTVNYTFTTSFNSPASTYDLCAFTKKTGDFYKFNDTTCVSINTTAAPDDAGVIAILMPGDSTITGDSIQVQVRIQNFGTNTLNSIPVRYLRNGSPVATETWTGTLLAGATADYTFTAKYVSPLANYSLCALTVLVGDANAANDQTCVYPLGYVGLDEYAGEDFYLWQNAPNPANGVAYIQYQVPSNGKVKFEVYDMVGQLLHAQSESATSGRHYIELNVSPWSTGIYYYSIEFEGQRLTRKMVISK